MKCQIHADLVRAPSSSLHTLTAPWPFSMWAFDIIGPFTKTVENTNRPAFILTAPEYYTKWAEAEAFLAFRVGDQSEYCGQVHYEEYHRSIRSTQDFSHR